MTTTATCKVTMIGRPRVGRGIGNGKGPTHTPTCDRPVFKYGLCDDHYADRIRLGGTP